MDILLRNAGGQPIYEQIYTQIKNQIISGALQPGEPLPSIRALAKDLRISVITTKRAYEELEKAGFIQTVAGKGCFVAPKNLEFVKETHRKELEDTLAKAVAISQLCNLTPQELHSMLDLLIETYE